MSLRDLLSSNYMKQKSQYELKTHHYAQESHLKTKPKPAQALQLQILENLSSEKLLCFEEPF